MRFAAWHARQWTWLASLLIAAPRHGCEWSRAMLLVRLSPCTCTSISHSTLHYLKQPDQSCILRSIHRIQTKSGGSHNACLSIHNPGVQSCILIALSITSAFSECTLLSRYVQTAELTDGNALSHAFMYVCVCSFGLCSSQCIGA